MLSPTKLLWVISTPWLRLGHDFLAKVDRWDLLIGLRVDVAFEVIRRDRLTRARDEFRNAMKYWGAS